jgi:N6-L-threonylcarbamoyladenine synthase
VNTEPLILGIESSCDETAAAVVRGGGELLSSVVASQIPTHTLYGGVVPELASREHLRNIVPVVRGAIEKAGLRYADLDAIAVTRGPGLAGALLVGVSFAKTFAWALGKPLIGVNHIEGHIHAVLLEAARNGGAALEFPVLALVVSGGHTHLYLAERRENLWSYREVGHTRDDAAGEAFDKTAKMLGLSYPGGPVIDRLARFGNPRAVPFTFSNLKHADRNHRELGKLGPRFDFSYSGIKTAVLRHIEVQEMRESIERRRAFLMTHPKPTDGEWQSICDAHTLDLIASFQFSMVRDLGNRAFAAASEFGVRTLLVSGGVAANSALRESFEERGRRSHCRILFPSRPLSTDNAAMIASAACSKWLTQDFAGLELSGEANLALR